MKVYLAMRQAIRTADMATIKKLARYPQDFEGLCTRAKFVKMMQEEEPQGIQVEVASEAGLAKPPP
ncbi:MAG: hypothetical protein U5J83_09905 [Bryobacterales bacterium]|nr:hypothetical protein [Bryobacterales bacterium]